MAVQGSVRGRHCRACGIHFPDPCRGNPGREPTWIPEILLVVFVVFLASGVLELVREIASPADPGAPKGDAREVSGSRLTPGESLTSF